MDWGFINAKFDTGLFIKHTCNDLLLVMVYMDDIIFIGTNVASLQDFFITLHTNFALKDLGVFHFFLGLLVTINDDGLHLC